MRSEVPLTYETEGGRVLQVVQEDIIAEEVDAIINAAGRRGLLRGAPGELPAGGALLQHRPAVGGALPGGGGAARALEGTC